MLYLPMDKHYQKGERMREAETIYQSACKEGVLLTTQEAVARALSGRRIFSFKVDFIADRFYFHTTHDPEAVKRLVQFAFAHNFGQTVLDYVMDSRLSDQQFTVLRPVCNGDTWDGPLLRTWLKDQGVQELVVAL